MGHEDVQGALLYLSNKQLAQEKKEEMDGRMDGVGIHHS